MDPADVEPNESAAADAQAEYEFSLTRREALKAGALGALAGWELWPRSAHAQTQPKVDGPFTTAALVFDEPTDRPAGAIAWPVTMGAPFANGALTGLEGLAITSGDVAAPAQFTKALDWRFGKKTISWAHCDFQATLGGGSAPSMTLRAGGPTNPAPAKVVSVKDDGDHFTVDTGAVQFRCNKKAFNLLETFTAGGAELLRGSALYWQDTRGGVYEAKRAASQVTVEKSGPLRAVLRAEGWYQTEAGDRKLRYVVWLHAFAGLPYVRIYDKLIWTENLTLYVTVDPKTSVLTTKGLFGDRNGQNTLISHGWATGDAVRWAYSHSDRNASGGQQQHDNTSKIGSELVVLPKVAGTALDRTTDYFVRAASDTTLTLHRTASDAASGANPIQFQDQGVFVDKGVNHIGRHYLQAQQPVLAEYGLKFLLAQPATQASVDIVGAANPHNVDLATARGITAHQRGYGEASLAPGVGAATDVEHLAGWAEARFAGGTGLAVAVKGLSQQTPKVVQVGTDAITIKLWGGGPMSLREEDRVLQEFKDSGYAKEWLTMSGEANPLGLSKTHEIWLWPTQSAADNRLINDLVQRPVACVPQPEYACGTDYILGIRAAAQTPQPMEYVETALENMLRFITARDPAHGDYDEWNFGDLRLFNNDTWRTWDNGGYHCSDLFWIEWQRTGKRFFLEEGMNNARHVMDVDTIAHSQTVTGSDTYQRMAGRTHNYATLQWAWPSAYVDTYVDHPQYLLLCWLMTGYEVARDVLQTKCSMAGGAPNVASYNPATISREQYGGARPKCVYYEFTGDEKFYTAGRAWLQLAMNAQAVSTEKNGLGTRLFPNNNFWGFFYEAFLYSNRYKPDAALMKSLAQTVDDFAVSPTNYFDAPTLACTWPKPARLGRMRNNMVRFVAAYRHTGDLRYLQYPAQLVLRQCRTVQTSPPFVGYDVLQGILAPGFVRGALMVFGALADAGFPQVTWPGNMPLFSSGIVANWPWASQITLWGNKPAAKPGRIRLIFKDSNLTPYEAPGRLRAQIVEPTGATHNLVLSSDGRFPVQVTDAGLVLTGKHDLRTGQPVRFSSKRALPKPLSAEITYFARTIDPNATPLRFSIHYSFPDALNGANAIPFVRGEGPFDLLAANMLRDASFTLPARGPAGAYRIHIQSESPLFRVFPASDLPGFVVALWGLGDLSCDCSLGAAEYFFRMIPGATTLTLSKPAEESQFVEPIAVLDPQGNRLGSFDLTEQESVAEIEIPPAMADSVLRLAKGYEESSPNTLMNLPVVRLDGAGRYVSVSATQWFNPLAELDSEAAAFWTMAEPEGARHDVTGHGRDLTEHFGPIHCDHGGPLGCEAQFGPEGESFLSSPDEIFRANGSFTIWGWARVDKLDGTRYLFVKGGDMHANPASCEWAIYASASPSPRIFFQARVGRKYAFTQGLPIRADGKLHFVVGWYDATARKIMLQLDDGQIASQALTGPINAGDELFGVGGSAPNGRGWVGEIAAVGFAKTALVAKERNLLYNGGGGMQFPF